MRGYYTGGLMFSDPIDAASPRTYNSAQFLRMSSDRVSSCFPALSGWNPPLRTTQQVDQEAKFASASAGDLTQTGGFVDSHETCIIALVFHS